MTTVLWILTVCAWVAAADGIRRPHAQWVAAGRDRSFWVAFLVLFGCLTIVFYVIGVLPKLLAAAREQSDNPFAKQ